MIVARRVFTVTMVVLVAAMVLAGCGRKGMPQPPPNEPNTYPRIYPRE